MSYVNRALGLSCSAPASSNRSTISAPAIPPTNPELLNYLTHGIHSAAGSTCSNVMQTHLPSHAPTNSSIGPPTSGMPMTRSTTPTPSRGVCRRKCSYDAVLQSHRFARRISPDVKPAAPARRTSCRIPRIDVPSAVSLRTLAVPRARARASANAAAACGLGSRHGAAQRPRRFGGDRQRSEERARASSSPHSAKDDRQAGG